MNFLSPVLAASPAETASPPAISVETALLLLLAVALLFIFRRLTQIHQRIEQIEAHLLGGSSSGAANIRPPAPHAVPGGVPVPAAHLAVIAASIHSTVDVRHRIVSVAAAAGSPAWSIEGRRQVLHSHRIR